MQLFLLLLIVGTTFCDDIDATGEEDQLNWVDPNDPFAGSAPPLKSTAAKTGTCPTQGRLQDDITLRLVIRRLLSQLRVDISTKSAFMRKATLRLSSYDVEVIANYLDLVPADDDLANRERVRAALHSFVYEVDDDSFKPFFEVWLEGMKPWVIIGGLFLIPMGYFFVFRNMIASRSFWGTTIILFVLLSMMSVYAGKYQKIMAERMSDSLRHRDGDACAPVGLWQQSFEFMSGLVTFKKKSACTKFMEDQMVPIMFEISLLEVFSDVVSNSVYRWISALGPHLNQFFRTIFDGVPIHGMILLSAILVVFFVLMFVRINTFFFTFEPMFVQCLTNVLGLVITGGETANRQHTLEGSQQHAQHNMLQTTTNLAVGNGPTTTPNRHRKKERRVDRKMQNSPSKKKENNSSDWSTATDGESSNSRSRSRGRLVRDVTPS